MPSQQHANNVLTSIEPAILVYSRAAIVLQGEASHQRGASSQGTHVNRSSLTAGDYARMRGHGIIAMQCTKVPWPLTCHQTYKISTGVDKALEL